VKITLTKSTNGKQVNAKSLLKYALYLAELQRPSPEKDPGSVYVTVKCFKIKSKSIVADRFLLRF
jgi:hypothetical protein